MCTTICLIKDDHAIVANNQDIFFDHFMIFTNKRNISKQALIMPPDNPLRWVSNFGSVTFSQCSKEIPSGGINEKGLVVTQLTLPETIYPSKGDKFAIQEMQCIQYLLDTCSTVDEAIKHIKKIKISQSTWPIHFMICDCLSNTAVIEFVGEKIIVLKNEDLEIKALSNASYKDSLKYMKEKDLTGCDDYKVNALNRFKIAADCISQCRGENFCIDYGFESLRKVSRDDTNWSAVYDTKEKKMFFRTPKAPRIKCVDLNKLTFDRKSSANALNASINKPGDVTSEFQNYNSELNRELVYSFFRNESLIEIMNIKMPDEMLEFLSLYPEQLEESSLL